MRIAIVDDEPDIREYLENIVTGMDHNTVSFSDGDRFMAALLRDTFDLVLLDWNLPGKTGLQILEWMQDMAGEQPAVIMMRVTTNAG